MQGLAVLLIGVSCRKHFETLYGRSVESAKTFITWLQHMRKTRDGRNSHRNSHGIVSYRNYKPSRARLRS